MSTKETGKISSEEIHDIVATTIKEVHEAQAIRFSKPETLRGWMLVIALVGACVGFIWTSIVFLNDVAEHHKQPYHPGAEELVKAVKQAHIDHINDNEHHRREEQLQLQILKETKPITEDIHDIKEDVRSIETKLDIIIDRQIRRPE